MRAIVHYGVVAGLWWQSTSAGAEQLMGLSPSTRIRARAEAVTAAVRGSDSLFYNPAALAWNGVQIGVISIESALSVNRPDDFLVAEEQVDAEGNEQVAVNQSKAMEEFYGLLNSEDPIVTSATIRAVEVAVPFISLASFATTSQSSQKVNDATSPYYDMRTRADVGLIAGFGVRYKKLALGFSQYLLVRAEIQSQPSEDQFNSVREALEAGTFSDDTVDYRNFSRANYGGARGNNFGMLYRFWEDNPSAIGVSVLNAGVTHFKAKAPIDRKDFRKVEQEFIALAEENNISLYTPEALPQVVNVGLNVGWGGNEADDVFVARASLDVHDVLGEHIKDKLAGSWELGIQLPDKIALATSLPIPIPIDDKRPLIVHVGVLGLTAYGGMRMGEYRTSGFNLALHLGVERIVSLLRFDIDYYELTPIGGDSSAVPTNGIRLMGGLTLIL